MPEQEHSEKGLTVLSQTCYGRRWLGVFALLIAAYAASLFLPHRYGNLMGGDAQLYYAYMRTILLDRDIDLTNDAALFNRRIPIPHDPKYELQPGRHDFSIGPAILWTPAFLAAHGLAVLLAGCGVDIATDGYALLEQAAVGLASVVLGCAALWLIHCMLQPAYGGPVAFWAALYLALASPFVYYQIIEPHMSHMASAFGCALFLFLVRGCTTIRISRAAVLALAAALMVLARWQDAIFLSLLLPAFLAGLRQVRRPGRLFLRTHSAEVGRFDSGSFAQTQAPATRVLDWALPWVVFAVIFLAGLLPQLLFWRAAYGKWLTIPQGAGFMVWDRPKVLEVLFSLRHGLFSWTPITLLATVGLFVGMKRGPARGQSLLFLILFAVATYVNGCVSDWWAGDAFGMRRYVAFTAVFAWGLGALLDPSGTKPPLARKCLHAVCAFLVAANIIFIGQYRLDMIPHSDPITVRQLTIDRVLFPFKAFEKVRQKLRTNNPGFAGVSLTGARSIECCPARCGMRRQRWRSGKSTWTTMQLRRCTRKSKGP